jgi:hypothetical protein
MNRIVYSTETPVPAIKVSPKCPHGKDAGQTCYPCDMRDEMDEQLNDVDMGDAHYSSFDCI